jgi:hypothetical protein
MGAFAPVMQFEVLCTLLTFSAVEGWHLCQVDVKRGMFKWMTYRRIIYEAIDRLRRWYWTSFWSCQIHLWMKTGRNHNLMLDFGYTHVQNVYCAHILQDKEKISIIVG